VSTFSEAWHNTPPKIRDFYRNFAFVNCRLQGTIPPDPEWPDERYFCTFGKCFQAHRGIDVAMKNWYCQVFETGSFDVSTILWQEYCYYHSPCPSPIFNPFQSDSWGNAMIDVPKYCWRYPCPKRRAKKSYWTGKPRHRRNI